MQTCYRTKDSPSWAVFCVDGVGKLRHEVADVTLVIRGARRHNARFHATCSRQGPCGHLSSLSCGPFKASSHTSRFTCTRNNKNNNRTRNTCSKEIRKIQRKEKNHPKSQHPSPTWAETTVSLSGCFHARVHVCPCGYDFARMGSSTTLASDPALFTQQNLCTPLSINKNSPSPSFFPAA